MAVMNSVEFEPIEIQSIEQVDENAGIQKFVVDTANDTIDVYIDNVNVSKQRIEEYLNRAEYAIAQETAVALLVSTPSSAAKAGTASPRHIIKAKIKLKIDFCLIITISS